MASILAIGIAAIDVNYEVDGYPAEDAEVRAMARRVNAGGNATNLLKVLRILGHDCALGAVLAADCEGRRVRAELQGRGIDLSHCRSAAGSTPVSCIWLNRRNGSRTIVHHRDLPEFGFVDFRDIDTGRFDWLHFEGRNVPETRRMLEHAHSHSPRLPISVEVEKPRDGIEALLAVPNVVMVSSQYARSRGAGEALPLLHWLRPLAPAALLVCAWGERGAWALKPDGEELFAPSCPPERTVDTVGAGDTFNAALIHALSETGDARVALGYACTLAGQKCGIRGFDGLASPAQEGRGGARPARNGG